MARSLNKVQKKISKKKGGKLNSLHENSRDAQRLRSAGAREDKVIRIMEAANRSNKVYVDRVNFFRTAIEGSSGILSEAELQALTENYIGRQDEELETEKANRRPGRPISKVEERINERKDAENREWKAGFWIPDLRQEEVRQKLERWSGDWAGLNNLKFIRLTKEGSIQPSKFPPKGLS